MTYEPLLITPFENTGGLNKYYKPFLIGNTAFPDLEDAYAWRGSIRKREGTRLLATLPTSPVQGLKTYINPSSLAENLIAFSTTKSYLFNNISLTFNDITFLAYPTGGAAPVTGVPFSWTGGADNYFWSSNYASSMWVTNNLIANPTTFANGIKYWNGTPGTVNVSGGWNTLQPTVTGAPTTLDACLIILPYKGRLVALNTMESGTSYQNRARWSQIGTPYSGAAPPVAIQSYTPAGATTTINSNAHGLTTGDNVSFLGFTGTGANTLNGVNAIVTYVNVNQYTVNITTTAGATNGFGQLEGVPPGIFFNDINAWRSDIPGKGGFIDADTSERIVSAGIVKDTLVVFFQRSTWRLRYTGNEILPFIWERLNTQYGSESTYSAISFDEAILAFSRFGWIASDTNSVIRIDEDIPDDSFAIESTDSSFTGLSRVQGIRDFYRQMAYWTYQSESNTDDNQIYAYNYLNKSWSIFNPTFPVKTFGYYRELSDQTWSVLDTAVDTWANNAGTEDKWSAYGGGENANFPYIVGGDASGNVYQMFEFFDASTNDDGTNFGFSITTKRFNPYFQSGAKCRVGYVDLYFTDIPGGEITFQHFIDDYPVTSIPIISKEVPLSRRGAVGISAITIGTTTTITTVAPHQIANGTIINMSEILGTVGPLLNNIDLVATVTSFTQFTVAVNTLDYAYTPNTGFVYSTQLPIGDSKYTRIFLNVTGNFHQFVITVSPAQIADPIKGVAQLELQALVVWTRQAARLKG